MAGFGSLLDPWKRAEDYAQELARAGGPSRDDAAQGVSAELERLLRPSFQHVVKLARRYESASRNAARRRVQRPARTEEQREERTRAAFMRAYLRFENTLRDAVGDDRIGAGSARRFFAETSGMGRRSLELAEAGMPPAAATHMNPAAAASEAHPVARAPSRHSCGRRAAAVARARRAPGAHA